MPSKAKFSTKTKKAIVERDVYCILCGNQGSEVHHVYFGTQSNYGPDRNNTDQGVLVCRDFHNDIHSCSQGQGKRQQAIEHIQEIHNGNL